ncbi:hypothetical protein [Maricaulis sp.]|uniref:hypothetical protein n=1 Tax=Maricaulis sp. TaxID=1486257 RepID=UPI002B26F2ED|nr:hypothetical protein [Maricaulis sp.]
MLTTFVAAMLVAFGTVGEGEEMVVGQTTAYHTSLIAVPGHDFYGLQIAVRRDRPCQVRAFFRGASPRTAQFCTRRMTRRQLAGAGTATLRAGERVNGISACFTEDERVGAVRLYTFADQAATAEAGECVTEYRTVWCQRGWTVQGVQLYFDRAAAGPGQASLVGLRPLCVNSA